MSSVSTERPDRANRRTPLWIAGLVVSISGANSLIYQVVWERVVRFNFGGDSVSSAIVAATFILGLGLGALAFGRWRVRPFRIYAAIEAAIGLYGIASYQILGSVSGLLGDLFITDIQGLEGLRGLVVLVCIVFLLPVCTLMGATLPLLFNCFVRNFDSDRRRIGLIYGLNTAGAAVGILAAPYLLLNHLRIPTALLAIGISNICLAVVIWWLGRSDQHVVNDPADEAPQSPEILAPASSPQSQLQLLILSALAGAVTIAYEIVLFRVVGVADECNSPYTYSRVLFPFLLALAAGSTVFASRNAGEGVRRRIPALFMVGGAMMLAVAWFSSALLDDDMRSSITLLTWLLAIPPAFFLGGIFPLLLRIASQRASDLPRQSGRIYLANSLGAFCGAMGVQFLGFQTLGTPGVLIALVVCTAIGASIASLPRSDWLLKTFLCAVPVFALLAGLSLPPRVLQIFAFGTPVAGYSLLEGATGSAIIDPDSGVRVNGVYMSHIPFHPIHLAQMSLIGLVQSRRHVLLLGLGGAGMVRELLDDPLVDEITVVDWSHELVDILRMPPASDLLGNALSDERVHTYRSDARVAVQLFAEDSFDLIIDNLSYASWVGSTNIRSVAYYRYIRRILKPGGTFVEGGNYTSTGQEKANLAAIARSFEWLSVHSSRLTVAADSKRDFDFAGFANNQRRRAELLPDWNDQFLPSADWALKWKEYGSGDFSDIEPVTDDLLIWEFSAHPICNWWHEDHATLGLTP